VPAAALVSALVGLATPAHAVKFDWGDFEGTFTSNISLGASWRMESPDKDYLSPGNTNGKGRASVSTGDDGNLNYDDGDLFSFLLKGVHDLDLNNGRFGGFARVKYWYDFETADGSVSHGHVPNGYERGEELDTGNFEDLAQDSGFEFLDYYLYADVDIGDMPLDFRVGNMVVSWGESTFIQNGINIISPFDATALRKPGSEIKEALLPTGLVYGNLGVTGDLSVEAFYQYEWDRTVLDECGTYWNSADVYGGGCNLLTVSTSAPDRDQIQPGYPLPPLSRMPDEEPSDSGQWGIAARYFMESLNATEFGVYYINYHSRTPILSGVNSEMAFGQPIIFGSEPFYMFEFPEDIEVYGLSVATNVGDWAISGELSYRPDYPLQINTVDITSALALGSWAEWSRVKDRATAAGPGGVLHGYDDVEYTQAQMTFVRFFEQALGASRLSVFGEVGAVWLDDMDDDKYYGRSPTFGIGDFKPFTSEMFGVPVSCDYHPVLAGFGVAPNSQPQNCTKDGFTDDFSWGYRVRAILDYSDVFAGINLKPNIAWSHDVDGNSPPPNFIEDRKALSLGLSADYLNIYKADLSYTTFFGADYHDQDDRDFLSLSFSVAF
jgi:hypothetical protein